MPVPEMPEIKYVEMPLSYSFWDKKAYLRQYTFDMGTGERTVDEKSKIGQPIQRGESIRIIYPLAESSDGKWVQAMGKDGTCGYIRKSRVDIEQLEAKAADGAKTMPLYRLKLTDEHKGSEGIDNYIELLGGFDETISISKDKEIIETSINMQEAVKHGFSLYGIAEKPETKTFEGALDERFDQDEATYGIRFCAEERCRQRVLFKQAAMSELECDIGHIKRDTYRKDTIMILGEPAHISVDTRKWMTEELRKRREGKESYLHDVGVIYMEDFMAGRDQKVLNKYLMEETCTELPHALKRYCDINNGFKEFLETVKSYNSTHIGDRIRIVAIGTEAAQTDTKSGFESQVERAAKFNLAAREIIDANLCPDGKRGLIYTGCAHAFVHPSLDEGKVILGFAQLYDQDVITIDEGEVTIHPKETIRSKTPKDPVTSMTQAQLEASLADRASEAANSSQKKLNKGQTKDKGSKMEAASPQNEEVVKGKAPIRK